MVSVFIDPSLGRRPASKWARAVQGAEGLSVAMGAPSRGLILPEGLGKLPRCDVWPSLEGTKRRQEILGRRSCWV